MVNKLHLYHAFFFNQSAFTLHHIHTHNHTLMNDRQRVKKELTFTHTLLEAIGSNLGLSMLPKDTTTFRQKKLEIER